MWTVSVLLEADRYKPSILNANEQILTHLKQREAFSFFPNSCYHINKMNNRCSVKMEASDFIKTQFF